MKNKYNKIAILLSIIFSIFFIYSGITSILENNWKSLWLSVLGLINMSVAFIFTYIANKKELYLPSTFQFITVLFLFMSNYLGEIKNYYITYWWFDLFLHTVFGFYGVIISSHLIKDIITKNNNISDKRFHFFIALFAFSFTVCLGTFWELFEFSVDFIFKTSLVKGGLEDTCTDLLIKMGAALLSSILYYYKKTFH